jgi:hypothetical protein
VDETLRTALERLHAAPTLLAYEFAGAGSEALHALHAVAGSSRTLLEATDRYASASLHEAIGPHARAVSVDVAVALARHARQRARVLAGDAAAVAGIAVTAAIATDRAKRGEHRVAVAAASALALRTWALTLTKGARDRAAEERIVTLLTLAAMTEAKGVAPPPWVALLPGEAIEEGFLPHPPLADLLSGRRTLLTLDARGESTDASPPEALVSGAFHPLHDGHLGLAAAAAEHLGVAVGFELAIENADKPTVAPHAIPWRAAQFAGRHPLVLSRAARFDHKARLLPQRIFVVGADTAARVLEARFYPDALGRDQALRTFQDAGCRFLVAGRRTRDAFVTLADLDVPARYAAAFEALPEGAFRRDVSSTDIRARWGDDAGG